MKGLTHERLVQVLNYDPETGIFTWAETRKKCTRGAVAGSVRSDGYSTIRIDYKRYYAHRLAWFYMMGQWPEHEVDHANGRSSDNAWGNLRGATAAQNMQNRPMQKNNKVGLKGVRRSGTGFHSMIQVDGRSNYLGTFDTAEKAHAAYRSAATAAFGEFARFE